MFFTFRRKSDSNEDKVLTARQHAAEGLNEIR
jgi:hypothetical protein